MLKTTGFIIANDAAIISVGATLADAIAAYNRDVGGILVTLEDGTLDYAPMTEDSLGGHIARPATGALLAQVDDVGGAISWEVVDGIACTVDEAAPPVPKLACIRDHDWTQITDGELDVRVDFTHRERAVEYRFLGFDSDDPRSQWTGTPFQGADFVLDATEVWRKVSAWLEES